MPVNTPIPDPGLRLEPPPIDPAMTIEDRKRGRSQWLNQRERGRGTMLVMMMRRERSDMTGGPVRAWAEHDGIEREHEGSI